jgi:predicted  nucleic acid-binding Zn-ribbon protein
MRLREDVTRLAASNSALEEKLADKNETIVRLNSRLRNLEKLGQALEQRGDELNQLDSEFHFEREQRLVLEKELKLLEKENQILHQKVDHLESEKSRQIELLNESKRGEVAYQM